MTENPHQPKEYDAVLGNQNSLLVNAAVLGGIGQVKQRLTDPDIEVRVAALKDAIKYGEAGLDLIIKSLEDEASKVKFAAYSLLKHRTETKVEQQLDKFFPFFDFDVITVNEFGQEISRYCQKARYFIEDLGNGVFLEMVSIPGGTFLMGSHDTEKKRNRDEGLQHQVTVPSFFMGKYQVTQAQWQAVAALPQINISLDANPSDWKSANLHIDNVSWNDAREFCIRLSVKTGKTYRLPREAEWEYACRAGTTTPFYFGETITTDLVNYNGNYTYASEPKVIERKRTDVGSFPPNAFGLYDMHGNIREWCADIWHGYDYDYTSSESVRQSGGIHQYRMSRGGSYNSKPENCRSASRLLFDPRFVDYLCYFGFRVVCGATWTL
ncbi:MAG TPA: formylglycine-generating enzyme family protein [Leptolyngbyaceae cyanobacterium]